MTEMAKVADLKAKFSQDLQLSKPPPIGPKKPVAVPNRPKVTTKPPGFTNGANKPAPLLPNGVDLKSVHLKPSVKNKPVASPKPWEKETESSSQPSVAELRNRLKAVSSQPSTSPKPQITPKPAAKPPVQSSKPQITPRPRNFSTGDGWKKSTASEGRDHSATGSIGSTKSDSSHDKEESFILAPLPPLETIGSPPKKPPKPRNVKLPPPTGVRSRKPVEPPRIQPAVPQRVPPPTPPDDDGPKEVYDDVETDKPPPLPPMVNRRSLHQASKRISLIPTMNSDDEMEPDELYDEGISAGPVGDEHPPVLPPLDSLPIHYPHQTSGGSSSSHIQTSGTSENTGSGGDFGEVYDPVEEENDFDDLYEPLDVDKEPASGNGGSDSNLDKEKEAEKKRLEKQRKEEEKQQKKEEERRKKEEKEEKKRKEKADKELKKKFKVKGDWTVEGTGTAVEDVTDEYDKLSVICTKGESLEILRKDSPNPAGKWLVRNERGDPGYIDSNLVLVEGDFGELYDDVGVSDGEDFQDVYDTAS